MFHFTWCNRMNWKLKKDMNLLSGLLWVLCCVYNLYKVSAASRLHSSKLIGMFDSSSEFILSDAWWMKYIDEWIKSNVGHINTMNLTLLKICSVLDTFPRYSLLLGIRLTDLDTITPDSSSDFLLSEVWRMKYVNEWVKLNIVNK